MLQSSRFVAYAETAGPRQVVASSQTPPQHGSEEQPDQQSSTDQPGVEKSSPAHATSSSDRNATASSATPAGRWQDSTDSIGPRAGSRVGTNAPADEIARRRESASWSEAHSGAFSLSDSAKTSCNDQRQSLLPAIERCASPLPAHERRVSSSAQHDAPAAPAIAPVRLSDTVQMGSSLGEAASLHTASVTMNPNPSAQEGVPALANSPAGHPTPHSSASDHETGAFSVPSEDGASEYAIGSAVAAAPAGDLEQLTDTAAVIVKMPAGPAVTEVEPASSEDSDSSAVADPVAVELGAKRAAGSVEDDVFAGAHAQRGDDTCSEASHGTAETGRGLHSAAGIPDGGSHVSSEHESARRRYGSLDSGGKHALRVHVSSRARKKLRGLQPLSPMP